MTFSHLNLKKEEKSLMFWEFENIKAKSLHDLYILVDIALPFYRKRYIKNNAEKINRVTKYKNAVFLELEKEIDKQVAEETIDFKRVLTLEILQEMKRNSKSIKSFSEFTGLSAAQVSNFLNGRKMNYTHVTTIIAAAGQYLPEITKNYLLENY